MARNRNIASVERIDAVPTIAGSRDLGLQFSEQMARGKLFAIRALELNPDLERGATDKTDDNVAFWKEFSMGVMSYWNKTHVNQYAVRHEDGTYTLEETSDDKDDLITAERAMVGCKEKESPSLHKVLKTIKEDVQAFIRDKKRDLRNSVKAHLNQGQTVTRGANKELLVWLADEIVKIETKLKTAANKDEVEKDTINGIRVWLKSLDGHLGA